MVFCTHFWLMPQTLVFSFRQKSPKWARCEAIQREDIKVYAVLCHSQAVGMVGCRLRGYIHTSQIPKFRMAD